MEAFARSCMHHVLMKCLLYARHVSGEMAVSDTKKIFAYTFQVEETDKKQNLKIIPDLRKLRWIGSDLLLVRTLALACVRMCGSSFSPQFCRVCGESWWGGCGQGGQ